MSDAQIDLDSLLGDDQAFDLDDFDPAPAPAPKRAARKAKPVEAAAPTPAPALAPDPAPASDLDFADLLNDEPAPAAIPDATADAGDAIATEPATPPPPQADPPTASDAFDGSDLDLDSLLGGDDQDLVFDDLPPPAPRAPAKGTPAGLPDVDLLDDLIAASPSPIAALAPSAKPAAKATPASPPPARDRRQLLLHGMVALAAVSSFASLGGLIAVGRSLATLNAERAQTAEQAEALAKIGPLVHSLDKATARLAIAAAHTPAPAAVPATAADVRGAIDDLKLALSRSQPSGTSALASTVQGSFAEIQEHLDAIDRKLEARAAAPRAQVFVTPIRSARH